MKTLSMAELEFVAGGASSAARFAAGCLDGAIFGGLAGFPVAGAMAMSGVLAPYAPAAPVVTAIGGCIANGWASAKGKDVLPFRPLVPAE